LPVTKEEIKRLGEIIYLDLTDEESARFADLLNPVLKKADELLEGLEEEPLRHISQLRNRMREDEVGIPMPKEKVLANAAETQDGCFRVPRILED
jgi:aspartyl-tRNA(Asn)/glutamyl-tRNA(Gln) amidotransferase subunit C